MAIAARDAPPKSKEKPVALSGVLKQCTESKDAGTCDNIKGCVWISLPKDSACFAQNCHLYEKVGGRASEDLCHRAPHCIFQKTPEGAKCFIDDCHVYGEDANEERGRKHCKFANHCRYLAKTEGREKHGCYWKDCTWYTPQGMAATAQTLCREAPKCKWEKGKCINQGKGGYARGKVPMDFKDDGENEYVGGPNDGPADDDSEPDAAEQAPLFHEEGGDGEGDGEGGGEPPNKGPPKKSKPGEDDAEGEEEDYETAMKKLSEKAGDL